MFFRKRQNKGEQNPLSLEQAVEPHGARSTSESSGQDDSVEQNGTVDISEVAERAERAESLAGETNTSQEHLLQPYANDNDEQKNSHQQYKSRNEQQTQHDKVSSKKQQSSLQSNNSEAGEKKHSIVGHSNVMLRERIKYLMNESPDFQTRTILKKHEDITTFYVKGAVNEQTLNEDIIGKILSIQGTAVTNELLKELIPITQMQLSDVLEDICDSLMDGWVFVRIDSHDIGILFNVSQPQYRSLAQSLNEANVLGPKLEFTESLETNVQVLRQLIKNEDLMMEPLIVGKRAPKEVRIIYMKGIADEENVGTLRDKISMLDVDDILDSSVLIQLIEENEFSLFPQLIMTEQPQRFAYSIMGGKVGLIVNGSPMTVLGPVTFFSFFESTEDLYFRWNISTFLRFLRFSAMLLSVFLTPAYVATLSFHYEIIPSALLVSIGQSRSNVPFPPVMEAILLEGLIELLREAGARLPTKVGQTIGIVGGIVIGQAAVEAGFTSNILIIVVAVSALASFTAPNYMMGTVIRVIRFPLIVLAGLAGGIGLMFGLCFMLIHLLKVTSLNRPYLAPLYPLHFKDFGQSIIRLPHRYVQKRSGYNEPKDTTRKNVPEKKKKKDIDE